MLFVSAFGIALQAHAQSTIGEVFICNYENDADYSDLMKVRDFYVQQAIDRFEAMSNCSSALMSQEQIFDGGEPLGSPPGYIHAFACNFRDGAGQSALVDLNAHLRGCLESSDLHKSFMVFQSTSLTPAPDSPDLRMFTVSENAAAWGARQDAIASSEDGQMLLRHVRAVFDCSSSHWLGENVVAPPAE